MVGLNLILAGFTSLTVMHFRGSEHRNSCMLHDYSVEPEGFLLLESFQEKINNTLPAH